MSDAATALSFYARDNQLQMELGSYKDGTTALSIDDTRGILRFSMGYNAERDEPQLGLLDSEGRQRVEFSNSSDGLSRLAFFDENEKCRHVIGDGEDKSVGMVSFDEEGKARIMYSLRRDGMAGFTLFDETEQVRANIGMLLDKEPSIQLFDQDGKSILVMPETRRILDSLHARDLTPNLPPMDDDLGIPGSFRRNVGSRMFRETWSDHSSTLWEPKGNGSEASIIHPVASP